MTDREALQSIYAECQAADSSTFQVEFIRHLSTIANLTTKALNEPETDRRVITDEQVNRLAQYLYEGINISPDVRLVMDMTSKATLVNVLKQAMINAQIIPDGSNWNIQYMHQDCPQCEHAADLAVQDAQRKYLVSSSWTVMVPAGDGHPTVGHRAVVERQL